MRALAITGIETAPMMLSIMSGSLIRETPPAARMSDGTRSRAMTATAPASSAILACSAVTTSMMTPPLSIWARPFLVVQVDVSGLMFVGNLRSGAHVSHAPGRLSHADLDHSGSALVPMQFDLGCDGSRGPR